MVNAKRTGIKENFYKEKSEFIKLRKDITSMENELIELLRAA